MWFWVSSFFVLVLGAALATRMAHGIWQAWVAWVGTSVFAWLVFWSYWGPGPAFGAVVAASFLGAFGPEIGRTATHGLRDLTVLVVSFLLRPGVLIALGLMYLFFFQQEFLVQVLPPLVVLVIILFGVWVMIGRPGRRRT